MEQRTIASQDQSQSQSQSRTNVPSATADDVSSIDDAVFDIRPENIPNTIITKAPAKQFRLGTWTVIGLVVNRMIGEKTSYGGCCYTALMGHRYWHLQFPFDCYKRHRKCRRRPALLVCWRAVHNRRDVYHHRVRIDSSTICPRWCRPGNSQVRRNSKLCS